MPAFLTKAFRPPEDCGFCKNVDEAIRLQSVSPAEFEEKYAYKGGPVIVTDAMTNWTAPLYFDYWFFKNIYENFSNKNKLSKCQFFPYKTGFKGLHEAFSISEDRVNYKEGTEPWYFGWSNCDADVVKILRQHYGRPYFLPEASENNAVDWIFIGGTGLGAHMHVRFEVFI